MMRQTQLKKRLRNWAIFQGARAAVFVLGLTPAFLNNRIARGIGALAYVLAGRERKIAIEQLCQRTTIGGRRQRAIKIVRGIFNHLGLSVVELCRLIRNPNNLSNVFIPALSRRALDEALSMKRGVIFVTGHIGNWELMAISLAREGYPIYTVAKKSYDRRFTSLIATQRARFGVHVIFRDMEGSSLKMLRAVRSGAVLGMLIDQDTQVSSVFVPFFGKMASTPSGAAAFAVRTGTPVVVGTIKRLGRGRIHRIDINAVSLPSDVSLATHRLTAELERRIRGQISQWVWFHRRWKTQPDRK